MPNRAGEYKTATFTNENEKINLDYINYYDYEEIDYECFMPTLLAELPPLTIDYKIIEPLMRAHRNLAMLDAVLKQTKSITLNYDLESDNDIELAALRKKLEYYDKELDSYTDRSSFSLGEFKQDTSICLDLLRSDDADDFKQLLRGRDKCEKEISAIEKLYAPIDYADSFAYMLGRKETIASFQIAETSTKLTEILYTKSDKPFDHNSDLESIIQYAKTLDNYHYQKQAISLKFLSEQHSLILSAQQRAKIIARDRPYDTNPFSIIPPTAFRDTQNWLDKEKRVKLSLAEYVPPEPDSVANLMSDLETFISGNGEYDTLIRAALIHYQLATIRPFDKGNGVINRLLTPLYLTQKGLLAKPTLCLSHQLNINRKAYFASLDEVRKSGNYEQWIRFFLINIAEAAKETTEIIHKLFSLRQSNLRTVRMHCSGTLENATKLFYFIEENPIFKINDVVKTLSLDFRKTNNDAMKFCECDILLKPDSSRNRVFVYDEYLKIIFGGEEIVPSKHRSITKRASPKPSDFIDGIDLIINS